MRDLILDPDLIPEIEIGLTLHSEMTSSCPPNNSMAAGISKAADDDDSGVEAGVQHVETRDVERDGSSIGVGTVSERNERGVVGVGGGGDEHGHEDGPIDPEAEKKMVWKCDLHVLPSITVLYFLAFMDRTNIGKFKLPYHLGLGLGMGGSEKSSL